MANLRSGVKNVRPPTTFVVPFPQDAFKVFGNQPTGIDPDRNPVDSVRIGGKRHGAKRELVREEVVAVCSEQPEDLRDRVRTSERHRRDVVRGVVVLRCNRGHGVERSALARTVPVSHGRPELCLSGRGGRGAKGLRRRRGAEGTPLRNGIGGGCGCDLKFDAADRAEARMRVPCKNTLRTCRWWDFANICLPLARLMS